MPKQPPKPKAKIVGEAEDWSDADIDRMASISDEDVAAAKSHWRRLAPKRARRLLDAQEADDE